MVLLVIAALTALLPDPAPAPVDRASQLSLFEFDEEAPGPESWRAVTDAVMGGVSTARLVDSGKGTASFEGLLSRKNRGGFATARSPSRELGLEGYDGIVVRVRGDGHAYKLLALRGDAWNEIHTWQVPLTAPAGVWVEQRIPFSTLVHTVMGRRYPSTGPLAPEAIRSISLSVAGGGEGLFALEVDWIRAYRDDAGVRDQRSR